MGNNISIKGDAASVFARHFVTTKYNDIPVNIVDIVKKSILDILGVSIAASTLGPGCRELAEIALEGGGKKESTLLVFGARVPAWMAAFVNGGLSHGIDFDDVYHEGLTHPSGAVIPAAFAIAERKGTTSGEDFITAIALGHDMVMRMMSSLEGEMNINPNWLRFGLVGSYAATATCGKLLQFDENKIQSAIGINICFSPGAGELSQSNLRGLYNSLAAKGSILSVIMAEKGIIGPAQPFEGDRGFFKVFFQGKYNRNILFANLGKKFYGEYIGYKVWPSCTATHASIDATLKLTEEYNIHSQDIDEIRVFVGTRSRNNFVPLEDSRQPKTILEAKFSIPFTVALASLKRRVTLADFTEEEIKDREVLTLAQKVVPESDPSFDVQNGVSPAAVEIKTKDGSKYTKRLDHVYGHYSNPMSMEAIINKFKDCTSYSAKPLSHEKLQTVIDMVLNLEQVDDVGQIIRLLG